MVVETILQSASQRPLSSLEIETLKSLLFSEHQVILTIDPNIYPLSAIQRAVYWLADDVLLQIEIKNPHGVCLIATEKIQTERLHALQNKILIALNDFTLRLEIEEKTAAIRQQLVQLAVAPKDASLYDHFD